MRQILDSISGLSARKRRFAIVATILMVLLTLVDIAVDYVHFGSVANFSKYELIDIGILIIGLGLFSALYEETEGVSFEYLRKAAARLDELNKVNLDLQEKAKTLKKDFQERIDLQFDQWKFSIAEKEIATLILKGLSLKEISQLRGVSERTIRNQSSSIYSKSNLQSRSELAAFFLEDILE